MGFIIGFFLGAVYVTYFGRNEKMLRKQIDVMSRKFSIIEKEMEAKITLSHAQQSLINGLMEDIEELEKNNKK